jgi:rhodanese-related sulfurtransferase
MVTKGFKELLAEANAAVDVISAQDAVQLMGRDDVVFIDVRESEERAQGTIPTSIHAPRGFLEFVADPEGPMHHPAFASGRRLIVFCGSGGRSVLASKTLHDMGIRNVANLAGGFQAWVQAGGEVTS